MTTFRTLLVCLLSSFLYACMGMHAANSPAPVETTHPPSAQAHRIALLLPLQGPLHDSSQAIHDGFLAAVEQTHGDVQVELIDTSTAGVLTAYQEAISHGDQLVVGPLDKPSVQRLAQEKILPIPVLALNYTDSTSSAISPANFYQFGLSPLDEARQLTQRAWQDGHREAFLIVPAGSWGNELNQAFTAQWQARGGHIAERLILSPQASALNEQVRTLLKRPKPVAVSTASATTDLKGLRAVANTTGAPSAPNADVIFLATPANATLTDNLLLSLQTYGSTLPIYATSMIYRGTPNPTLDTNREGIIFTDIPWILSSQQLQIVALQSKTPQALPRLYALGIDAYLLSQVILSPDQGFLKNLHILGVSGNLSMDANRRIQRQMPVAQFKQGQPTVIDTPISAL